MYMDSYQSEEDLEDDGQPEKELDIKGKIKKSIEVDKDEQDVLYNMFKISKWQDSLVEFSDDFHDKQIGGYEAKVQLMAFYDLMNEMREELLKSM